MTTPSPSIRDLVRATPVDELTDALTAWSAGRSAGDVAFAFGQAISELEPLEDPYVSLDDLDDPFGPPAFDGLASTAWRRLKPGDYTVATTIDGQDAVLRVTPDASAVISPPVTADAVAMAARFPNPAAPSTGEPDMSTPETQQAPNELAPSDAGAVAAEPEPQTPGRREAPAMAPPGIRVTINGNVATEPTYGVTDAGKSWARLRIASNERVRDADEWKDAPPEYTEVVLFGTAAETAVNTLTVGDPVIVKGRPEVEQFTRRDGEPAAALKVFASSVTSNTTVAASPGPERAVEQTVNQAATIRHAPDSTVVVGVSRDDKELQGVLKENGFKWSAKHTAWYLPTSLSGDQRTTAVAVTRATAHERGLAITIDDAPAGAGADGLPAGAFTGTPEATPSTSLDIGH